MSLNNKFKNKFVSTSNSENLYEEKYEELQLNQKNILTKLEEINNNILFNSENLKEYADSLESDKNKELDTKFNILTQDINSLCTDVNDSKNDLYEEIKKLNENLNRLETLQERNLDFTENTLSDKLQDIIHKEFIQQIDKINSLLNNEVEKSQTNQEVLIKLESIINQNDEFYHRLSTEFENTIKNGFNTQHQENLDFLNKTLSAVVLNLQNTSDEIINTLNNDLNSNNILLNVSKNVNELKYHSIFKDMTSKWLINTNSLFNNENSNYSLIYLLYKILNETKPKNILELGINSITNMTVQYSNFYENTFLDIVEENNELISIFSDSNNLKENVKIHNQKLEEFEFNNSKNIRYSKLNNVIKNNIYDLIIVDGPITYNQKYPRTNILNLIENLNDDFIIILNDYESEGLQNTSNELKDYLDKEGINYQTKTYNGYKQQIIFFTDKFQYNL